MKSISRKVKSVNCNTARLLQPQVTDKGRESVFSNVSPPSLLHTHMQTHAYMVLCPEGALVWESWSMALNSESITWPMGDVRKSVSSLFWASVSSVKWELGWELSQVFNVAMCGWTDCRAEQQSLKICGEHWLSSPLPHEATYVLISIIPFTRKMVQPSSSVSLSQLLSVLLN